MENKQEDLKSTKEILFKYENRPTGWQLDDILQAMAEYADQFKKQLKEKEEELTKSNEMAEKLADALIDIKNWDDRMEDKWEDQGLRAISALKEYQNSKK